MFFYSRWNRNFLGKKNTVFLMSDSTFHLLRPKAFKGVQIHMQTQGMTGGWLGRLLGCPAGSDSNYS